MGRGLTTPTVSPFNYLSEAPERAAEPSSCDVCIAARLRMRAGSPYFDGTVCSNIDMMNGTTLCITPPGPQLPPPVTTNIPPLILTTAAPAPTDAAGGSNKPCGRWYDVEAGDCCNLVVLKFAISLDDFLFLDTGINANCTNLYAGESYCVQPVGDSKSSLLALNSLDKPPC